MNPPPDRPTSGSQIESELTVIHAQLCQAAAAINLMLTKRKYYPLRFHDAENTVAFTLNRMKHLRKELDPSQ